MTRSSTVRSIGHTPGVVVLCRDTRLDPDDTEHQTDRQFIRCRPDPNKALDAEADAFAQLLALSPNDPDQAFRDAAALAKGLFPHQIEGVAFLLGRRRAILADDMGLGKSRQAIVGSSTSLPPARFSSSVRRR